MTADAVFVWASSRTRRRQLPAGCFGRLVPGATVHGVSRVRMHLEADLGRDAGALDQLAEASDCERCTPL